MESVYSQKTKDLQEEEERKLIRKEQRQASKKTMQDDIRKRARSWRNPNFAVKDPCDDTSESTIRT